MFDLSSLPTELQWHIYACIHRVCIKHMTIPELSKVRMVNVRLAATFYKRCMMMTMLDRYKPFMFLLEHDKRHKYYDLHGHYDNPCTLPMGHLHLQLLHHTICTRKENSDNLTLMQLRMAYVTQKRGFLARSPEEIARLLLDHRTKVHLHLKQQERHLLSFKERRTTRSKHMEDDSMDLFPREWVWI